MATTTKPTVKPTAVNNPEYLDALKDITGDIWDLAGEHGLSPINVLIDLVNKYDAGAGVVQITDIDTGKPTEFKPE